MGLQLWRLPDNEFVATIDPGPGVNAVERADGLTQATFRQQVSAEGSMELELPLDAQVLDDINLDRDYVRCYVDGELLAAGVIERIDERRLSPEEGAGLRARLSGRGQAAVMNWWPIIPAIGVDRLPTEEDRLFSWQSPQFDSSAWADVAEIATAEGSTRTAGDGIPMAGPPADAPQVPGAFWIWADEDSSISPPNTATPYWAPGGTVYARKVFNLATTAEVEVGFAMDDIGSIWIDGQPIGVLSSMGGRRNFLNCHKVTLRLSSGDHTLAIVATNRTTSEATSSTTPNPAGIFCYAATLDDDLTVATVLAQTDDTWDLLGYPATPPGMTAGQALDIALTEAQAEGFFPWLTWDFDEDLDSNGDAWADTGEITTRTGNDLLTFLGELANTYIDWVLTPDMTTLRAFNRGTYAAVGGAAVVLEPAPVTDPRSGSLLELDRVRQ
jgi:hypothetical protein